MYSVVGVRFKKAGKIYYFDPIDLPIEKESAVIVETARGVEYGKVVVGKKNVKENDVVLPLKKVIRIADDSDARDFTGTFSYDWGIANGRFELLPAMEKNQSIVLKIDS